MLISLKLRGIKYATTSPSVTFGTGGHKSLNLDKRVHRIALFFVCRLGFMWFNIEVPPPITKFCYGGGEVV